MIYNATVQIGEHFYTLNWAVANTRYDALLGMPWHKVYNPKIDYRKHSVHIEGMSVPIFKNTDTAISS